MITGFDARQTPAISRFGTGGLIAGAIPKEFKPAILETPERNENDHFGENIMVNRGVRMKVTLSLDDALKWLNEN